MRFRFIHLLFALTAAAFSAEPAYSQGALDGPGVSLRLARLRAHVIRDVKYDLSLDVTARDSAVGAVTVRFDYVDTGDVLLVMSRDRAQDVKKAVDALTEAQRHEVL